MVKKQFLEVVNRSTPDKRYCFAPRGCAIPVEVNPEICERFGGDLQNLEVVREEASDSHLYFFHTPDANADVLLMYTHTWVGRTCTSCMYMLYPQWFACTATITNVQSIACNSRSDPHALR